METWILSTIVGLLTLSNAWFAWLVNSRFRKESASPPPGVRILPTEIDSIVSQVASLNRTSTQFESRLKGLEAEWADTFSKFSRLSQRLYRQAGHDRDRQDPPGATTGPQEVVESSPSRRDILRAARR